MPASTTKQESPREVILTVESTCVLSCAKQVVPVWLRLSLTLLIANEKAIFSWRHLLLTSRRASISSVHTLQFLSVSLWITHCQLLPDSCCLCFSNIGCECRFVCLFVCLLHVFSFSILKCKMPMRSITGLIEVISFSPWKSFFFFMQ